jgi:dTDP-4-dehydrorhamnose reductase
MVRKLMAFILLVSHLNTSMFIPQMAEVDVYDSNGAQVDDINTLVEYIDQEVLGHPDSTPEDEDDDTERTYHVVKSIEFSWHPFVQEIQTKVALKEEAATEFADYSTNKPAPGFTNIFIPPPKA